MNIKKYLLSLMLVVFAGSTIALAVPQSVGAGDAGPVCEQSFLGFPTWFRGLIATGATPDANGNCNLVLNKSGAGGIGDYVWLVVLNVIEMVMMLVVYLSVIFIIYGGVLFIASAGSADGVKKGKASITNAVIGLVISIVAVAVVEFIFSRLTAGS